MFLSLFTCAVNTGFGAAYTWNGSVSSAWNDGANWTGDGGWPDGNNDDATINTNAPRGVVLHANLTIDQLTLSGTGYLDLNGFTLLPDNNSTITGGSIGNGELNCGHLNEFTNATTFGDFTFRKRNAGGNLTWSGGNTFGNITIIHEDNNRRIRMANVSGDTFNGTADFQNTNSNWLQVAYNAACTFAEDVTFSNTNANGSISFGEGGGTAVLAAGKSLVATSFAVGNNLYLYNVTSPGTTALGSVTVDTDIRLTNSSIKGDMTLLSTGGNQDIVIDNCTLLGTVSMTADRVDLNNSSTISTDPGKTFTVVKTDGGGDDYWDGGNTFGPISVTNQDVNDFIRISNVIGDTYTGSATFINSSSRFIDISYNGTSTFAENVSVSNTHANGFIRIGENGGISTLAATKYIFTPSYAQGDRFTCKNVNSPGNGAFGTVVVTNDVDLRYSIINGDINATSTAGNEQIYLDFTTLSANTTLTAGNIELANANSCATVSGTCTIVKTNGGNDDSWVGGNTFGPLVITNQDNGDFIRLSQTNGDTYNGTATFINSSTGFIDISYAGGSTFAGNVSITNSDANGFIRIGENGGGSLLAAGMYLYTPDYNQGDRFTCKQVVSPGTTAFGTVQVSNDIDFTGSSINGDLIATSTGGNEQVLLNGTTLSASTQLTGDNVQLDGSNSCATVSGTCTIVKTDGGDNDIWTGGNTFGDFSLTNQDVNSIIRLANDAGDAFNGTATFVNEGESLIDISYAHPCTYAENVSISNLHANGSIRIGQGGGTTTLAAGKHLFAADFNQGNEFICLNVSSPGTTAFGTVEVSNNIDFTNSSINGDIVATSTGGNRVITLDGTTLSASATLTGDNVQLNNANSCATVSGTCTIVKTDGGNDDDWTGGNTFGNLVVTNQDTDDRIRISNVVGDTYNGTVSIVNSSSGHIDLSYIGTSTFAENLSVSNTDASGFIRIGENGGVSTLAATKYLFTPDYNQGDRFTCKNLNSPGTTAFGTVQVTNNIDFSASTISGDIIATSTGGNQQILLDFTTLSASATLTADNVQLNNPNNCATVSGTCTILKTDGGDNDDWIGGNTFGALVLTNQDGNSRIRLSSTNGDTYNSTVSFINASSGYIDVSYSGGSDFAEDVQISNLDAGGYMRFGENGGGSALAAGKSLIASSYATGASFTCNNVISPGTTAFGTVNTSGNIDFNSSTLNGDITATTSGGGSNINVTSSNLRAAVSFTSDDIEVTNACTFSTVSGNCTFTKTEGGGNNHWAGGNTFGRLPNTVTFINQDVNNRFRLADSNGDVYEGNVVYNQAAGGDLQPAYNSTSNYKANISTVGTTNAIQFGDGNGVVQIGSNGVIQSFLTTLATKPTVARLTMNTTGGGSLELDGPVDVSNTLTMTSGVIKTNEADGDLLTLTDEGVTTDIGTATSYVSGPLDWQFTSNSGTRSTLVMPLGKATEWGPIELRVAHSANTSYTYRSEFDTASARNLIYLQPPTIKNVSNQSYYHVNRLLTSTMTKSEADLRNAGASAPDIKIYYTINDDVSNASKLRIVKTKDASPGEWFDIGGVGTGVPSGYIISTSSPSAFSEFSLFALANDTGGANALPVEILSFDVNGHDKYVDIIWEVSAEINNDYWIVERSFDGAVWEQIAILEGAGNSTQVKSYNYIDVDVSAGLYYYRVAQVDFDGVTSSTEVKIAELEDEKEEVLNQLNEDNNILVFPNPVKEKLIVSCKDVKNKFIQVLNFQGQELGLSFNFNGGDNVFNIDVSSLSTGVYFIVVDGKAKKFIKK